MTDLSELSPEDIVADFETASWEDGEGMSSPEYKPLRAEVLRELRAYRVMKAEILTQVSIYGLPTPDDTGTLKVVRNILRLLLAAGEEAEEKP